MTRHKSYCSRRLAEAEVALRACVAYIPCSEVHNWPPGFELKREALRLSRAFLATVDEPCPECFSQGVPENGKACGSCNCGGDK
jgi:hypothetical protein